jgi:hypothetical protein
MRWGFLQGMRDEWRWYRCDDSGAVLGSSNQGFSELRACMENAEHAGFRYSNYQVHARASALGASGSPVTELRVRAEPVQEQWQFVRDARNAWYWRHTRRNGSQHVSSHSFETMTDCVADAVRHGYVPSDREPIEAC